MFSGLAQRACGWCDWAQCARMEWKGVRKETRRGQKRRGHEGDAEGWGLHFE